MASDFRICDGSVHYDKRDVEIQYTFVEFVQRRIRTLEPHGQVEEVAHRVEELAEMFSRLLEELRERGSLSNKGVLRVIGVAHDNDVRVVKLSEEE